MRIPHPLSLILIIGTKSSEINGFIILQIVYFKVA